MIHDVSKELSRLSLQVSQSSLTVCAEQIAEVCTNFSVRRIGELPAIRNYINYYFYIDFVSFSITGSVNVPIFEIFMRKCNNLILKFEVPSMLAVNVTACFDVTYRRFRGTCSLIVHG